MIKRIALCFLSALITVFLYTNANTTTVAQSTPPLGTVTLPLRVPVLVLKYLPPAPNNPLLLDGTETGWGTNATINGRTLAWWEARTDEMVQAMLPVSSDASRYHGYKDPEAPAFFDFQVEDSRSFYMPIPRGVRLGWSPFAYRPNYGQILGDLNICDYVDNRGVKEVWMYGYHSSTIEPDESRMSSRYGDISNSYPKEELISTEYRMPICNNSYVLYNYTFQPGGAYAIANPIHNRIHQIENIIPFAEGPGKWPPIPEDRPDTNIPGSIFWGDFSEYIQSYTVRSSYNSSCGNAHFTPNWGNLDDAYRYGITTPRTFNCESWHPDDAQTTYITAGCERWGCTDLGFYKWFMQNIPGFNSGIVYNGEQMKNWWEAMYDFNAFIDNGRSLYGSSLFTIIVPTPTPTPTITPSLIPTSTVTPTPSPITFIETVLVSDDAYVAKDSGKTNFGASTHLLSSNSPVRITYLKFNLSSFSGRQLISAVLRMRTAEDGSTGSQRIKRVNGTSWTQSSLTYSNKPGTSSTITTFIPAQPDAWQEIDITSYISGKLGEEVSLAIDTNSNDTASFYSLETDNKPALVLTYR